MMRSTLGIFAAICVCLVAVALLDEPELCASDCDDMPGTISKGWPTNTTVGVKLSNLPESITGKDDQGDDVSITIQYVASLALDELSSWLSSNSNSGVTFTHDDSSSAQVTLNQSAVGSGDGARPSGGSVSVLGGVVQSANLNFDLSNANNAPSAWVDGSGRSGTVPFFDPAGTISPHGASPANDFIDYFKNLIKHELMHTMGLDDQPGANQNTIMNGGYVPNDRKSDLSRGMPSDLTYCDYQALKQNYPYSPEDDPAWWEGVCGVTDQDVHDCEHQQDAYFYDFYSCGCEPGTSPIIFDLDRKGLQLTDPDHGVRFDLLNNGVPVQTAWTQASSSEAFLVLDRNRNGFIDSGAELFGNVTDQPVPPKGDKRNGFLALAQFDLPSNGGNGDGVITAADAVFNSLRLWIDRNHDGISEPDELLTLASQGIGRIDLDYHESRRIDQFGNVMRYVGEVWLRGSRKPIRAIDVFFRWQR